MEQVGDVGSGGQKLLEEKKSDVSQDVGGRSWLVLTSQVGQESGLENQTQPVQTIVGSQKKRGGKWKILARSGSKKVDSVVGVESKEGKRKSEGQFEGKAWSLNKKACVHVAMVDFDDIWRRLARTSPARSHESLKSQL